MLRLALRQSAPGAALPFAMTPTLGGARCQHGHGRAGHYAARQDAPDVMFNGVAKHTLFLSNDNDFIGTVTNTGHPAGRDNPNLFMVYPIDKAEGPGFMQQGIGALHKQAK